MLVKSFSIKTKLKFAALLLLFFLSNSLYAQMEKGSIKGTVKSEKGGGIGGVSVSINLSGKLVKNVETDSLGFFQIDSLDISKSYDLNFDDINYESSKQQNIKVGADLNITLKPDHADLNEVVVVGYGTQKKKDLTSAVVEVKSKDFNAGGARNAMDLIQGKVAGLNITRANGNNPNSSVKMQLRGVASIKGTNSPLVVIDGVPGGNLDLLQQSDIESISVLKDGSAAAIYGTRANGGVILVTTKKGKSGAPTYDYNGYGRKEYLYRYPKVLTADQFRSHIADGSIANEKLDKGGATDWFDGLINHSNFTNYHNLALSGGSANTNYRGSIYYSNMEGIAKANTRKQYGATISIHHKGFNNLLTTDLHAMINYSEANLLGGGGDADDSWGDAQTALFGLNPTQSAYDTSNLGGFWNDKQYTNVISKLQQESRKRNQQTSLAQLRSTLRISKDLSATMSGSIQRDQYNTNQYKSLNSQASQNDVDYPGGGYAKKENQLKTDFLFEPNIEYNSSFSKDHVLSGIVGYSYQYHKEEYFSAENKGFTNDQNEDNNLGAGNALGTGKAGMSSNKFENKLIGFFGRVSYAYKSKYLAQVILRHEGSTRFGSDKKWGNFPAVSLGWVINQESFMQNVNWIDNLKLRAGYGITGNQDFDNGISQLTLGTGGYYIMPDGSWSQTYGINQNPNPDLRWERKKELNLGLDFSILNSLITGSLDVYHRKTSDLAVDAKVEQPSNVVSSTFLNVGELSTSGIELALGITPIQGSKFTWHVDVAASHAISKLNKYYNGNYLTGGNIGNPGNLGDAERIEEGNKIGQFYGKRFAGFTDKGKWLFYNKDNEAVSADDITPDDYAYLGNGIPKYYASLGNTFNYKNMSLRIFFRGKFGYQILNTMDIAYANPKNFSGNLLDYAFTKYAKLDDNYQYSDYYLQNGNYVKLDEVTFSYNFPMSNKFIRNLSLYVTGSNLWLMTGYKGNDPDFVNDTGLYPGMDGRGVYPSTRSFLIGANIGF